MPKSRGTMKSVSDKAVRPTMTTKFTEVFTEFYNWASERKEFFDEALDQASSVLARAHAHARHASICVGYVRGDTSW